VILIYFEFVEIQITSIVEFEFLDNMDVARETFLEETVVVCPFVAVWGGYE